jgi:hypothetical protein
LHLQGLRARRGSAASLCGHEALLPGSPGNVCGSAHEYLGEAYLMVGNLAKAEEHLSVFYAFSPATSTAI